MRLSDQEKRNFPNREVRRSTGGPGYIGHRVPGPPQGTRDEAEASQELNEIRVVMIPSLDPDPKSDFQLFGDSGSAFRSSKKWTHYSYIVWGVR